MYMLFAGDTYYPLGGWEDFKGFYPSVESAKDALLAMDYKPDWWQIVESAGVVVHYG